MRDGRTVTVNSQRYIEVINTFSNDLRRTLTQYQRRRAWFQQDGAPPHTANDTIEYINELFRRRVIALGSDFEWAPHSPDLNPLDFWFWGAAKESVYKARPETLDQLKDAVSHYARHVSRATCRKVGDNFKIRVCSMSPETRCPH